ncbi:acyl-CoA dehydrogenase family protein [Pseudomonas aeruginosa]|nr:acyl-CoA dehydrogenase family protein [Pseudomonas aeruginosa]
MSDYDSLDDNAFRLMVREWIAANYPQRIRNPPRRLGREKPAEWYLLLSRQGWLCPGWPREYGGMGLSAGKQLIMMEEMERVRLRAPARQRRDHARPIVDPLWRRGATGALPAAHSQRRRHLVPGLP